MDQTITLTRRAFLAMLKEAAAAGAKEFCDRAGIVTKDTISQNEAHRRWSRRRIEKLVEEQLIHPVHPIGGGRTISYSIMEIETALSTKKLKPEL